MKIHRSITVFDGGDLDVESRFWAELLGGVVEAENDWHSVSVDGEWRLGFQRSPNHVAPDWPADWTASPTGAHGYQQQQQVHLDLYIDDLTEAHDRATALGARLLQESADPQAPEGFQVYADPAGHPFCLCWSATD